MFGADLTMNMIEFFDDPSNVERHQVSQSTASKPGVAAAVLAVLSPDYTRSLRLQSHDASIAAGRAFDQPRALKARMDTGILDR